MFKYLIVTLCSQTFLLLPKAWASSREERSRNQEIFFTTGEVPALLDPVMSSTSLPQFWASYVFEGLMRWEANGKTGLGMADSLAVTADGLEYTFKLRSNALWSDGSAVTADDFLQTFLDLTNPKLGSENADLVRPLNIKNLENVLLQKLPPSSLGVHVLNSQTLKLTLSQPCPYVREILALSAFAPTKSKKRNSPTKGVIGNGPFKVSLFEGSARLRLEKAQTYWDKSNIGPNALEMPIATDNPLSSVRLLQTNELDVIWGVSSEAQQIAMGLRQKVVQFKSGAIWFLLPNFAEGKAFANKGFAEDFAKILDRTTLVKKILDYPHASVERHIVPSYLRTAFPSIAESKATPPNNGSLANPSDTNTKGTNTKGTNTKETNIKEASATKRWSAVSLTLVVPDSAEGTRQGEYLQQEIFRKLGATVKVVNVMSAVRYAKIRAGEFDLAAASTIPWFPDASAVLQEYTSDAKANYHNFKNKKFDGLIKESSSVLNKEKRTQNLAEAEKILLESYGVFPTHESGNIMVHPYELTNVSGNVFGPNPDFRFAKWVRKK